MTGGRAIRAETRKLLSLPATYFTLLGTLGVSAILSTAFSRQDVSPVGHTQAGFIVLGVIAVTSEYSGGQIHRTLTAMPRRITQHLAKIAALLIVAAPAAVLTVLAGGPRSAVVGASAYLTLTTILSATVATVLRWSVPAVAGLLGYYFIAGPLLRDRAPFAAYLPDAASHDLRSLGGSAVVLGWVLVAVGISAATFHRRDA
ncbi:hypothetical protein LCL61_21025 [Amycolatopsis coloradensis]|uniref:Uncharacterized protein n=1 Tax=Amycolatopsis coloradensis TaxID=76021 RepID=A0ACD5BFI1_9PSEU